MNINELKQEHGDMSAKDMWVVLQAIIVKQLGVDYDEVTRSARFVEDLGLG